VTLSFGTYQYYMGTYEPLIEKFQAENPNIKIRLVNIEELTSSGGTFDEVGIMRKIVSNVDTANIWSLSDSLLQQGFFYDMRSLIDADPSFKRDDYFPGVLDSVSFDGGIYMLPTMMQVPVLSYNKQLWEAKGLTPPPADWTWQDVLKTAEQLAEKRGENDSIYGMTEWGGFTPLTAELFTQQPNFSWGPIGQAQLDRPEVAAALTRVNELVKNGVFKLPKDSSSGVDDMQALITEQRVGIWASQMLWDDSQDMSFEIGMAAQPPTPNVPTRYVQGHIISSGTQHPEAAWRWLTFLDQQVLDWPSVGENSVQIHPRPSIAERSGYWDGMPAERRTLIEAMLARPSPVRRLAFDPALYGVLDKAIQRVLSGEQTPEQSLQQAQVEYNEETAKLQQTPTAVPGPIIVATPAPVVEAATDAVKLTFALGYDDGSVAKLIERFNKENPTIFVDLKIDTANQERSPTAADYAQRSDVFEFFGMPSGLVTSTLDLRPLMEADPTFQRDDFPSAVLNMYTTDGVIHALPQSLSMNVLVYNVDLFTAAAVAEPNINWTLNDFILTAEALTSGEGSTKKYGFAENMPNILDLFIQQNGSTLTVGEGAELRPNFTDPKVLEGANTFIDFIRRTSPEVALAGYTQNSWADSWTLRNDGRLAMWTAYGLSKWEVGPESGPGTKKITILPGLKSADLQDLVFVNGLAISAQSQHPQEAWTFLNWMSKQINQRNGGFPVRISVAESDEFLQSAPDGAAEVYKAYLELLQRDDQVLSRRFEQNNLNMEYYWFYRAVDRVLRDSQVSLENELDQAQRLTEQYLACVRGDEKPGTCAKTVDPEYKGFRSDE
jgi:ABC-type glycerol-3-phosphate transport system substrate-binding protein